MTNETPTSQESQKNRQIQALAGEHGEFAKHLANAFTIADSINASKLADVFPELFDEIIG